jgi:hypothetical protein
VSPPFFLSFGGLQVSFFFLAGCVCVCVCILFAFTSFSRWLFSCRELSCRLFAKRRRVPPFLLSFGDFRYASFWLVGCVFVSIASHFFELMAVLSRSLIRHFFLAGFYIHFQAYRRVFVTTIRVWALLPTLPCLWACRVVLARVGTYDDFVCHLPTTQLREMFLEVCVGTFAIALPGDGIETSVNEIGLLVRDVRWHCGL